METLPVIELKDFLQNPSDQESVNACKELAKNLHETGVVIIRDPRVSQNQNDVFLDMMERYFDQPFEVKKKDARPQFHYQIGCTPENTEVPRDNSEAMAKITNQEDKPLKPNGADPKWRYFWRIGERPQETEYKELNEPQVIPEAFKDEWENTMNTWGKLMLEAVSTVAEMAAVGLGLPQNSFIEKMKYGPHLLAPTGSDLSKYGSLNTIFAGFHYDLNFLTIHGKSRYPGLMIWLRNGKKLQVKVPDGCLLVQAGKEIEHLTGGYIAAGFHEVAVIPETLKAIETAKEKGRPTWRVSSTLFSHIASDQILIPQGQFNNNEALQKYPQMKAGEFVQKELEAINLANPNKEKSYSFYG